jgi:hypothetical protein
MADGTTHVALEFRQPAPAYGLNPYSYVAPHLRPAVQPQQYPGFLPLLAPVQQGRPQLQGAAYLQGAVQPYPGMYSDNGGQGFLPHAPYAGSSLQAYWQLQTGGTRQQICLAALPFPQQGDDVEMARWNVQNCWPTMPADCVPGLFFSFSQTEEIFTIRAPRDGEEWMRLNPRQDQQRWAALNAQLAVLSSSRVYQDRTNLEQLESLVQPTQFLEHLRKTMPMSEAQLDMVSTMLETMTRRLNALEVLFKGGQKAVDEFMSSTMTGIEKLKSSAILKAKRSSDNSIGPPRK